MRQISKKLIAVLMILCILSPSILAQKVKLKCGNSVPFIRQTVEEQAQEQDIIGLDNHLMQEIAHMLDSGATREEVLDTLIDLGIQSEQAQNLLENLRGMQHQVVQDSAKKIATEKGTKITQSQIDDVFNLAQYDTNIADLLSSDNPSVAEHLEKMARLSLKPEYVKQYAEEQAKWLKDYKENGYRDFRKKLIKAKTESQDKKHSAVSEFFMKKGWTLEAFVLVAIQSGARGIEISANDGVFFRNDDGVIIEFLPNKVDYNHEYTKNRLSAIREAISGVFGDTGFEITIHDNVLAPEKGGEESIKLAHKISARSVLFHVEIREGYYNKYGAESVAEVPAKMAELVVKNAVRNSESTHKVIITFENNPGLTAAEQIRILNEIKRIAELELQQRGWDANKINQNLLIETTTDLSHYEVQDTNEDALSQLLYLLENTGDIKIGEMHLANLDGPGIKEQPFSFSDDDHKRISDPLGVIDNKVAVAMVKAKAIDRIKQRIGIDINTPLTPQQKQAVENALRQEGLTHLLIEEDHETNQADIDTVNYKNYETEGFEVIRARGEQILKQNPDPLIDSNDRMLQFMAGVHGNQESVIDYITKKQIAEIIAQHKGKGKVTELITPELLKLPIELRKKAIKKLGDILERINNHFEERQFTLANQADFLRLLEDEIINLKLGFIQEEVEFNQGDYLQLTSSEEIESAYKNGYMLVSRGENGVITFVRAQSSSDDISRFGKKTSDPVLIRINPQYVQQQTSELTITKNIPKQLIEFFDMKDKTWKPISEMYGKRDFAGIEQDFKDKKIKQRYDEVAEKSDYKEEMEAIKGELTDRELEEGQAMKEALFIEARLSSLSPSQKKNFNKHYRDALYSAHSKASAILYAIKKADPLTSNEKQYDFVNRFIDKIKQQKNDRIKAIKEMDLFDLFGEYSLLSEEKQKIVDKLIQAQGVDLEDTTGKAYEKALGKALQLYTMFRYLSSNQKKFFNQVLPMYHSNTNLFIAFVNTLKEAINANFADENEILDQIFNLLQPERKKGDVIDNLEKLNKAIQEYYNKDYVAGGGFVESPHSKGDYDKHLVKLHVSMDARTNPHVILKIIQALERKGAKFKFVNPKDLAFKMAGYTDEQIQQLKKTKNPFEEIPVRDETQIQNNNLIDGFNVIKMFTIYPSDAKTALEIAETIAQILDNIGMFDNNAKIAKSDTRLLGPISVRSDILKREYQPGESIRIPSKKQLEEFFDWFDQFKEQQTMPAPLLMGHQQVRQKAEELGIDTDPVVLRMLLDDSFDIETYDNFYNEIAKKYPQILKGKEIGIWNNNRMEIWRIIDVLDNGETFKLSQEPFLTQTLTKQDLLDAIQRAEFEKQKPKQGETIQTWDQNTRKIEDWKVIKLEDDKIILQNINNQQLIVSMSYPELIQGMEKAEEMKTRVYFEQGFAKIGLTPQLAASTHIIFSTHKSKEFIEEKINQGGQNAKYGAQFASNKFFDVALRDAIVELLENQELDEDEIKRLNEVLSKLDDELTMLTKLLSDYVSESTLLAPDAKGGEGAVHQLDNLEQAFKQKIQTLTGVPVEDLAVKVMDYGSDTRLYDQREPGEKLILERNVHSNNIVEVYALAQMPDIKTRVVLMEKVKGPTLEQIIKKTKPGEKVIIDGKELTLTELVRQVHEQIGVNALETIFEQKLIYPDMKPANIMIEIEDGKIVAKLIDLTAMLDISQGKVGPPYMFDPYYQSPQQARSDTIDQRSQVFSLAASLYESLTGQRMSSEIIKIKRGVDITQLRAKLNRIKARKNELDQKLKAGQALTPEEIKELQETSKERNEIRMFLIKTFREVTKDLAFSDIEQIINSKKQGMSQEDQELLDIIKDLFAFGGIYQGTIEEKVAVLEQEGRIQIDRNTALTEIEDMIEARTEVNDDIVDEKTLLANEEAIEASVEQTYKEKGIQHNVQDTRSKTNCGSSSIGCGLGNKPKIPRRTQRQAAITAAEETKDVTPIQVEDSLKIRRYIDDLGPIDALLEEVFPRKVKLYIPVLVEDFPDIRTTTRVNGRIKYSTTGLLEYPTENVGKHVGQDYKDIDEARQDAIGKVKTKDTDKIKEELADMIAYRKAVEQNFMIAFSSEKAAKKYLLENHQQKDENGNIKRVLGYLIEVEVKRKDVIIGSYSANGKRKKNLFIPGGIKQSEAHGELAGVRRPKKPKIDQHTKVTESVKNILKNMYGIARGTSVGKLEDAIKALKDLKKLTKDEVLIQTINDNIENIKIINLIAHNYKERGYLIEKLVGKDVLKPDGKLEIIRRRFGSKVTENLLIVLQRNVNKWEITLSDLIKLVDEMQLNMKYKEGATDVEIENQIEYYLDYIVIKEIPMIEDVKNNDLQVSKFLIERGVPLHTLGIYERKELIKYIQTIGIDRKLAEHVNQVRRMIRRVVRFLKQGNYEKYGHLDERALDRAVIILETDDLTFIPNELTEVITQGRQRWSSNIITELSRTIRERQGQQNFDFGVRKHTIANEILNIINAEVAIASQKAISDLDAIQSIANRVASKTTEELQKIGLTPELLRDSLNAIRELYNKQEDEKAYIEENAPKEAYKLFNNPDINNEVKIKHLEKLLAMVEEPATKRYIDALVKNLKLIQGVEKNQKQEMKDEMECNSPCKRGSGYIIKTLKDKFGQEKGEKIFKIAMKVLRAHGKGYLSVAEMLELFRKRIPNDEFIGELTTDYAIQTAIENHIERILLPNMDISRNMNVEYDLSKRYSTSLITQGYKVPLTQVTAKKLSQKYYDRYGVELKRIWYRGVAEDSSWSVPEENGRIRKSTSDAIRSPEAALGYPYHLGAHQSQALLIIDLDKIPQENIRAVDNDPRLGPNHIRIDAELPKGSYYTVKASDLFYKKGERIQGVTLNFDEKLGQGLHHLLYSDSEFNEEEMKKKTIPETMRDDLELRGWMEYDYDIEEDIIYVLHDGKKYGFYGFIDGGVQYWYKFEHGKFIDAILIEDKKDTEFLEQLFEERPLTSQAQLALAKRNIDREITPEQLEAIIQTRTTGNKEILLQAGFTQEEIKALVDDKVVIDKKKIESIIKKFKAISADTFVQYFNKAKNIDKLIGVEDELLEQGYFYKIQTIISELKDQGAKDEMIIKYIEAIIDIKADSIADSHDKWKIIKKEITADLLKETYFYLINKNYDQAYKEVAELNPGLVDDILDSNFDGETGMEIKTHKQKINFLLGKIVDETLRGKIILNGHLMQLKNKLDISGNKFNELLETMWNYNNDYSKIDDEINKIGLNQYKNQIKLAFLEALKETRILNDNFNFYLNREHNKWVRELIRSTKTKSGTSYATEWAGKNLNERTLIMIKIKFENQLNEEQERKLLLEGTQIHFKDTYNIDLEVPIGEDNIEIDDHVLKPFTKDEIKEFLSSGSLQAIDQNYLFPLQQVLKGNQKIKKIIFPKYILKPTNVAGIHSESTATIYLNGEATASDILSVLLHEIGHAVLVEGDNIINIHQLTRFIKEQGYDSIIPNEGITRYNKETILLKLMDKIYQNRINQIVTRDQDGNIANIDHIKAFSLFPTRYSYINKVSETIHDNPKEFFAEYYYTYFLNQNIAKEEYPTMYSLFKNVLNLEAITNKKINELKEQILTEYAKEVLNDVKLKAEPQLVEYVKRIINYKDLHEHVTNIRRIARPIIQELKKDPDFASIDEVVFEQAALLHDLGKVINPHIQKVFEIPQKLPDGLNVYVNTVEEIIKAVYPNSATEILEGLKNSVKLKAYAQGLGKEPLQLTAREVFEFHAKESESELEKIVDDQKVAKIAGAHHRFHYQGGYPKSAVQSPGTPTDMLLSVIDIYEAHRTRKSEGKPNPTHETGVQLLESTLSDWEINTVEKKGADPEQVKKDKPIYAKIINALSKNKEPIDKIFAET